MPDLDWIKDYIPNPEQQQMIRDSIVSMKERLMDDDGIFSFLSKNAHETLEQFRTMLKERENRNEGDLVFRIFIKRLIFYRVFIFARGIIKRRNSLDC